MKKIKCKKCNHMIAHYVFKKHFEYCDGLRPRRKRPKHKYGKAWATGLTKETDKRIKRISESLKNNKSWQNTSQEKKYSHSKRMRKVILKRYENGWDPKAGRCKKYKYKNFSVDGTWELEFCKWADSVGLNFERNSDRFEYKDEKGNLHKYKPDFKINSQTYIEIKGYQTKRDLCKWIDFPHILIILKKAQIKRIKNRTFLLNELFEYKFGEMQELG